MKSLIALAGMTGIVCGLAVAQTSDGNRLVIPPTNGVPARQVRVRSVNIGITVKGYDGKDVVVERGSSKPRRDDSHGMHRIDLPHGFTVEVADNVVDIQATPSVAGAISVLVPIATSLSLHSTNGSLSVQGVHGEIDAHTTNGRIQISGVSGTVLADTTNGGIHVAMDSVDQSKPLAFSTSNGVVDVTLPADLKADVRFNTNHGAVYSDFAVTLAGNSPFPGRSGRARSQGRINGGGVQIDFRTSNSSIYLHKK